MKNKFLKSQLPKNCYNYDMSRKKQTRKAVSERLQFGLITQEAVRQMAQWKVAKINDYGSVTGKCSRVLFQIARNKTIQKEIKTRILGKTVNSILGKKLGLKTAAIIEKSLTHTPEVLSVHLSSSTAIKAARGILRNTAKAGLISALVDGLVASAEIAQLVSKNQITKKNALRRLIKETSGGAVSGMAGIGTIAMLTALSAIPLAGQIAILASVNVGVKRFWNRLY